MARWMMLVLMLGACSEAAVTDAWTWDQLGGSALGQVDLVQVGEVRLGPDGPALEGAGGAIDRPLTLDVVAAGERLAVVERVRNLELVLWIDRGSALTWTSAHTEGGEHPGGSGIVLHGVQGVEVVMRDEQASLVRIERERAWVEAWFPSDDLDQVRTEEPGKRMPESSRGESAYVRLGADIFGSPGGDVIGGFHASARSELGGDEPVAVRLIGEPMAGFTPIEWVDDGVSVHAWVRDAAIDADYEPPGLGYLFGSNGTISIYSSGCGMFFIGGATVPAGSLLYDDVEGEVVGEALDDEEVLWSQLGPPHGDGWRSLQIWTRLGEVEVWLAPEDAPVDPD